MTKNKRDILCEKVISVVDIIINSEMVETDKDYVLDVISSLIAKINWEVK